MTILARCLMCVLFIANFTWISCQGQRYNSLVYVHKRETAASLETTSDQFDTVVFPIGTAIKEISEVEASFPEGTANKETSSSFESEPETNSLSSMLEPPLSSSSPSIIPSTETFISQEKTTVYATVYEYPDATETATVTEIDTSYGFTFEPGSVLISTDAFDAQSTITLTEYAQDYVLSGTTVTPSVSYTTEYVTLTTTIEPLNGLQPSTMLTTVTTTSTDTVTVTESTNAPEVLSTAISDNYTTETSTSIEISLQTEALWTQTLINGTSTEVNTMRSLDRFQPNFVSTKFISTTYIQNVYTTTTTPTPTPQQQQQEQQQPPPQNQQDTNSLSPSSISSSSSSGSLECFYFGGINARCILVGG